MLKRSLTILTITGLMFGVLSLPAMAGGGMIYTHLSVRTFEAPEDKEFPPNFAQQLKRNLVLQLTRTNRFRNISLEEGDATPPADTDVVLTGKIVSFKKGNRAVRYFTVPGVGATKIKAVVEFRDPKTGRVFYSAEVTGKVLMGVMGGDSLGATNGLAKGVAKIVQKHLP
jgi:hypothetical protein